MYKNYSCGFYTLVYVHWRENYINNYKESFYVTSINCNSLKSSRFKIQGQRYHVDLCNIKICEFDKILLLAGRAYSFKSNGWIVSDDI